MRVVLILVVSVLATTAAAQPPKKAGVGVQSPAGLQKTKPNLSPEDTERKLGADIAAKRQAAAYQHFS